MTNVKEFSEKYYITEDTVIDCGEEVWDKFRQYVYDHVTQEGGIKDGCAKFSPTKIGSGTDYIVIGDKKRGFRWCGGKCGASHEYTKQDILNILHYHGYHYYSDYGYIKQEEQPVSKFKAMKFRVKDAEHSAHIQKYLFSLGYIWASGDNHVQYTDTKFLYAEDDGRIYHGMKEYVFHEDENQEYTLDVHTEVVYTCVPVEKPRAMIELNGVRYYVDDLEKALQHIKLVENA